MGKYLYRIVATLILCTCLLDASAQESSVGFENGNNQYVMRESTPNDIQESPKIKPVTIGLEVGASIDMGGNDYSSFDVDVYGGYRSQLIKCLGLGIGYHNSFSHNRYYIPIYAIFRSNLSTQKNLFFVDFRSGYSINQMSRSNHQGGFFGSAGVGINLSVSKRFGSHILLGYNFYQLEPFTDGKEKRHTDSGCHLVGIRLGISF